MNIWYGSGDFDLPDSNKTKFGTEKYQLATLDRESEVMSTDKIDWLSLRPGCDVFPSIMSPALIVMTRSSGWFKNVLAVERLSIEVHSPRRTMDLVSADNFSYKTFRTKKRQAKFES